MFCDGLCWSIKWARAWLGKMSVWEEIGIELEKAERGIRLWCKCEPKERREGGNLGWKHSRSPCSQRKVWQSCLGVLEPSWLVKESSASQGQTCLCIPTAHRHWWGEAHRNYSLGTNTGQISKCISWSSCQSLTPFYKFWEIILMIAHGLCNGHSYLGPSLLEGHTPYYLWHGQMICFGQ